MANSAEVITTYQIIKEIIIPATGILTTMIIGIVIAVMLKRREEKAKIKSLLIDSYMEYLNKRGKFLEYESLHYIHDILTDIYSDYKNYFEDHANSHFPKEQILKTIEVFKRKLDTINMEETNWTVYTYRFCFLLSTKVYNKKAQGIENSIVSGIMQKESRMKFLSELKHEIKENVELRSKMNALNINTINSGIDTIVSSISSKYSNYQLKIFKPYDNLIADLIDKK